MDDYSQLAIERHGHLPLLARIWRLRNSLTAHDGAYVALAEALGAPCLTCDGRMLRARGHFATVELIDA